MENGIRKKAVDSAKSILPQQGSLVPSLIPEITFIKMAAEKCFIDNIQDSRASDIRKALIYLEQNGQLD